MTKSSAGLPALGQLRQYGQQWAARVDARTLRERVIIFALAALVLLVAVNHLVLDPLFARQRQLSQQIGANQEQQARLQAEIQQAVRVQQDPDAANRSQLAALTAQAEQLQARLQAVEATLVPPEKMTVLLKDVLQRHGALQLVSLKTLPVTPVLEERKPERAAEAASRQTEPTAASTLSADAGIYRHGVEIVVQGGYLDMLKYLQALEDMPWQVFWGQVVLKVDEHPQATLTLTLHTLSMDKTWLHL